GGPKSSAIIQEAATTIQASWRGFLVRRQIATENAAASTIQAAWRVPSPADRERATVVLQAHYRGYVVRRTLRECSRAATTIQAHWRGYCVRRAARGGPRRPELPRAGKSCTPLPAFLQKWRTSQ
uniref:Uncharacterized protein n=1 Tax=Varanus komodoensis TaxID=61221 RepID=A0A8D2LT84_VARKO